MHSGVFETRICEITRSAPRAYTNTGWVNAGEDMSDLYDKIKEDVAVRRKWAERCGFGFELPSVVPNVPKTAEKTETAKAA